MNEDVNVFLEQNLEYLKNLIIEITTICSPTGYEKAKAEIILKKLNNIGAKGVHLDNVGNVIYEHNVKNKATLYCAHIDTVFNDVKEIVPKVIDDKIYAPSVADNSMNVAGLILMVKLCIEFNIDLPIIFAFDVAEEGLGDLKGIKHIMQNLSSKISEVIALDCSCDEIINRGVGSKRYKVSIKTEGGHSWVHFGNLNAIAIASNIITKIYELNVPEKTTYNVGAIEGGTTVNTIAAETEFLLDIRAEKQDNLDDLEKDIIEIIKGYSNAEMTLLGNRQSGGFEISTELEERILKVRESMGLKTEFKSASTDSNIPLSMKIPAITFGVGIGHKVHSVHEYLELNSLERGIKQLAYFMLYKNNKKV